MAELPILPLKTDALLADTSHLSAEEFGAYCRILFVMWRHEARLVDDADELARIAGVPLKRWKAMAERVMRPMTISGGLVSQKRLSATWLDVRELRAKRADAANRRWSSKPHANASAGHIHKAVICNANQNQIVSSSFSETAREEGPQAAIRKACSEATRQELEALYEARRAKRGT